MKLQQKLNNTIITNIEIVESENRMYYNYNHLELAEKCEKVAEDFAIEFAEWLRGYKYDNAEIYHISSTKELLEIYKQEKKL
jgi:hypothetical protein